MPPFLLLAAALAFATEANDVGDRVVRALRSEDHQALRALSPRGADLGNPAWSNLRDAIEKYDCIEVLAHETFVHDVQGDRATLELHVHAVGVTAGTPRAPSVLPRTWRIHLTQHDGRWQIDSVITGERHIATLIAQQTSEATRRMLVATPGFDRRLLLEEMAEVAFLLVELPAAQRISAIKLAIELAREDGDVEMQAIIHRLLATFSIHAGDVPRALVAADESLILAERSGSADALAAAWFARGVTRWFNDDVPAAIENFDRAGDLIDRLHDPRRALKALHMAVHLLQRQGAVGEMMQRAEENGELARRYGWREGVMNAFFTRAIAHQALQHFEAMITLARQASDEAKAIGNDTWAALALYDIAFGYASMQRWDDAIGPLEEMLATESPGLNPGHRASGYTLLGAALKAKRRYEAAAEALRKALTLAHQVDDRRVIEQTLVALSNMRREQGRLDEALRLAREAVALSGGSEGTSRVGTEYLPWSAKTAEAEALRALGRTDEALAAFRASIVEIEKLRTNIRPVDVSGTQYFRSRTAPYLGLAEMLLVRGDVREALLATERVKGRALRDVLEEGRTDLWSLMTPLERHEHLELEQRITDLNRARGAAAAEEAAAIDERLRNAQLELEMFRDLIFFANSRLRPRADAEPRELSAASVPPDGAILDYVVGEDAVSLFAITRDGDRLDVRGWRIPISREELDARVRRFTRTIETRDLRWQREARALHALLVKPAAAALQSRKTICIVPDHVLWLLPFETLLDDAAIFYAPSLSVLDAVDDQRRDRSSRPRRLLAFANPSTTDDELEPLPETEEEVRAIAELYGRGNAKVYVRAAASETTAKREAPRYDVLHFATHGQLDDRSPMFSSLVLTPGDRGEDGQLEARELLELDLNADLAILSACETGRGAIRPGEGIVGLSWAFLAAGCPTTVASRWKAESRSTATLMRAFHRQLIRGGTASAEALRRARAVVRNEPRWAHPYYWAAFQVVGMGW